MSQDRINEIRMKKYRVWLAVVVNVEARNKEEAATKARRVSGYSELGTYDIEEVKSKPQERENG